MSVKVMGQVWELDLSQPLKLLALALADWAHDDGTGIFASKTYMAWRVGAHPKTIQRQLKQLQELGVLEQVGWHLLSNGYYTKLYTLHPERGSKLHPLDREGGARGALRGSTGDPKGEHSYAPQTIREPLENQRPDFEFDSELPPRIEGESQGAYLRRLTRGT